VKIRLCLVTPLVLALAALAGCSAPDAAAAGKRFVCPPCGSPCDTASFAAPGQCPRCGMTLVEAGSSATEQPPRKRVAILVFDGVEVLDFSGPYEMFGAANCDVYTVAATRDPVTSAMGLTVVPRYSFAEAPAPDVLVVPGGGVGSACHDPATLRFVKDVTARAAHTLSVCNGAFILANAGLLDGLAATTTDHNLRRLATEFPKTRVVDDRRYVDNGKIITTAGLSAGMDGALHVIARLFGTGYAQEVALGEEYDWKPSGGFARAALADHQIPDVPLEEVGHWDVARTEGDRCHWDYVVTGTPRVAAPELMRRIAQALAQHRWTKVGATGGPGAWTSRWRFTGSDGHPWTGTLKLEGDGTSGARCTASLSIACAG
jgi:putative intracellular protease/amidase